MNLLRKPQGSFCRRWGGRAVLAAGLPLVLVLGGCSSGTPGSPDADATTTSGIGDRLSGIFSSSSAKSPQPVIGAQADVNCPPLEVREGASTLVIGPGGQNATMSVKYQGSFVRTARECRVAEGNMVMRIGVQGRVIVGPAGAPGSVDVPIRIAVVRETPGASTPITTKLIRIPVTIGADLRDAPFTHIEEGLSFPLPIPSSVLDDYVVYVGFDPLAVQAPEKEPPKPKQKHKGKPPASSG
jgi:hypothetical protein